MARGVEAAVARREGLKACARRSLCAGCRQLGVRAEHASARRRRARGDAGAWRAVQEVGHHAGRGGVGEARDRQSERDAAGRRRDERRRRRRRSRRSRPKAGAEDTVFIVLFGHGTFAAKVAKFNLTGPRHGAAGFRAAAREAAVEARGVREHGERERAVRGGAVGPRPRDRRPRRAPATRSTRRSSAGRSSTRSPPSRPTATATGRCRSSKRSTYAKKAVAASYVREGLMPTEHGLLEDNGDKQGSMEPGRQAKDGQSAAVLEHRLAPPAGAADRREDARAVPRAAADRAADRSR